MSLSIGAIGSYGSMAAIEPINYSIKNKSQVSDSYMDSIKETGSTGAFDNIDAVAPVMYPNAMAVDPARHISESKETSNAYNKLASSFQGMTTGYDSRSAAQSYGQSMLGSNFDFYA